MGILSALGLKRKDNTLEEEITKLKQTVEEQNSQNFEGIRNDIRNLFSELQSMKMDIKNKEANEEKNDVKISSLAEKIVEMDNHLLRVVNKEELDLVKKELNFLQDDLKMIKDTQNQITDKFIDFALNKNEFSHDVQQKIPDMPILTDFEKEILDEYDGEITSEAISLKTGMSKGHVSRTLKGLNNKGYLIRKRKGKEFIYIKQ